ncbi:MAG: tRNA (adenosine(37)-N6)-threonylcarbamoyltransferase complex dimerization subunit type 1 TsaB [Deltaproteobacteria bacterium]|nr:MAG: tRNA (adenosine(37)-N6)-threonylcarbamoyltransferase complex dimerization subunit type 1 TsaB [Deltaproteobacteria bacterium]
MKMLAIDTSTASCSVALLENRQLQFECIYTAGNTHSRHLMEMIDQTLAACRFRLTDLDGFAVTSGPGTFTGLRIGISTVKGLAVATCKPVVGVSSLAALTHPLSNWDGPVIPMIDARRGEVYWTVFKKGSNEFEPSEAVSVCAPETAMRTIAPGSLLVGSGAQLYRDLFKDCCPQIHVADDPLHVIRAASVGLLALERFRRNDTDPVNGLIPDYIRKSDAQIQKAVNC